MRVSAKNSFRIALLMAVLLISSHGLADEQSQGDQASSATQELPLVAPDLGEIIPMATELSRRLVSLENRVLGLLDIAAVERGHVEIEEDIKELTGQLQQLKDSKDYRYSKIANFKQLIEQEHELFEVICDPLNRAISQLGALRKNWLAEKERWNQWQSSLLKDPAPDQIQSTFAKANNTIETALKLVLEHLETMLTIQTKAGNIQEKINALAAELDGMSMAKWSGDMVYKSPPMFSGRYFSQFSRGLWYAVRKGLDEISWPDNRFFVQNAWVILLQVFISLAVIIAFYRKREVLKSSKGWRFLAGRPFSAGLFFGVVTTWLLYEYIGIPIAYVLALMVVCVISFARLSDGLTQVPWKRRFIHGVIIVFIVTRLMNVVSLPLPLFRLYTVLIAILGLLFCLRLAVESSRNKDSILYTWSLRLLSCFFIFIIIAEIWGKEVLVEYLFVSLVRSIAIVFIFMLFIRMIRGGVEWLLATYPFRISTVLHRDNDAIIRQVGLFIAIVMWGLVVLPEIIMIWGVSDTLDGATKDLLALGFNLGSQRISVGLVIASIGIIYGTFLLSWIFQKVLMSKVFAMRQVESGVRLSIERLVHYVLITIGFFLAISILGFDITKLTIMLGALGIGIGFGLQGVVSNFISGLILLFEQPVRVGDTIEIEGKWAKIKMIGLRATTVQTLDHADVIIPNADLTSNLVTNWTLSNRKAMLKILVGVAYGSNVPLVIEKLIACGKANSYLAKTPKPQVLFLSFGDSSLDFELRVWVRDADNRLKVTSELHQEIDRSFREAKIEIAFPQQDLHLRSLDESVTLRPRGSCE
jgi:potassium efflux system protein